VACIHDEIILEVTLSQAEAARQILEQVMIEAGQRYLPDLPVVVESVIADSWAGK
jgi:DNA polymerase I-like protein with 3'-5' exonuclease and polymerase domains